MTMCCTATEYCITISIHAYDLDTSPLQPTSSTHSTQLTPSGSHSHRTHHSSFPPARTLTALTNDRSHRPTPTPHRAEALAPPHRIEPTLSLPSFYFYFELVVLLLAFSLS